MALLSFLRCAAGSTESALVIIQHLLSGQPSRLTELIAGWTSMPVQQILDGVTPQCSAVYVVSPG